MTNTMDTKIKRKEFAKIITKGLTSLQAGMLNQVIRNLGGKKIPAETVLILKEVIIVLRDPSEDLVRH